MIKIRISLEEAEYHLNNISHGRFKKGKVNNWKVNKEGNIKE